MTKPTMGTSNIRSTSRRKMVMALALAALMGGATTGSALAKNEEGDHRRHGRSEREDRRELEWREHDWRERHPNVYVAPGYYYAPPPVVYAPPPVPPSINFVFPLDIR